MVLLPKKSKSKLKDFNENYATPYQGKQKEGCFMGVSQHNIVKLKHWAPLFPVWYAYPEGLD